MWRVEIDVDHGKTLVPLITINEWEARNTYEMFRASLIIDGVVRLYAPDRLMIDYYRVTKEDYHQCF